MPDLVKLMRLVAREEKSRRVTVQFDDGLAQVLVINSDNGTLIRSDDCNHAFELLGKIMLERCREEIEDLNRDLSRLKIQEATILDALGESHAPTS